MGNGDTERDNTPLGPNHMAEVMKFPGPISRGPVLSDASPALGAAGDELEAAMNRADCVNDAVKGTLDQLKIAFPAAVNASQFFLHSSSSLIRLMMASSGPSVLAVVAP